MTLQGNYETKSLVIFLSIKNRTGLERTQKKVVSGDGTAHEIIVLEGF